MTIYDKEWKGALRFRSCQYWPRQHRILVSVWKSQQRYENLHFREALTLLRPEKNSL